MLFKIMNFCEIDKYAVKSYCAIHGVSEQINLRDVSTVNTSDFESVASDLTKLVDGSAK